MHSSDAPQLKSEEHAPVLSVPLVVAVTGHRDLLPEETDELRKRVHEFFLDLIRRYPDRQLRLLSPLAEGADSVAAEVALDLGIDLVVPLPMTKTLYLADFDQAESRQKFVSLLSRASEVYELPAAREASDEQINARGPLRDLQYAQLGVFLCAHCHILLALWDGKYDDKLGGTGQVVRFHHNDTMPGYTRATTATQQMLVDDESDLVYHIVCSRNRPDGAPADGLVPLDTWWFTKDEKAPRSRELPAQHRLIFERSAEFGRDARKHGDAIARDAYPLYDSTIVAGLPAGVSDINALFCAADWLALHFQKKVVRTLRISHALAFLMGMSFILYTDVQVERIFLVAFLLFFAVAAVVQLLANRRGWHRKYLDYRALAEGLRVQFYWAVAGVVNESESKFSHDNFLQAQDPELGWIRNVMRVAGTRCDVRPYREPGGLAFVLGEWIGDADHGQLAYFARKTALRIKHNRLTENLGLISLLASVAVVAVLLVVGTAIAKVWVDPLMAVMGSLLLIYGIRKGYAYALAEKELIKQYEFMLRIFRNARRRLDNTDDPDEQRLILRALGGSALDEHSEWILMHRDRSIEQGELWRMGS